MNDLPPVAQTLLIPLACRAHESQRPDAILRDPRAVELVRLAGEVKLPGEMDRVCILMRARQFDRYAQSFLAMHPDGTVVDIGCGLDTRFERLDNGQMHWVGLDLPEVIEIRQKLLPPGPRGRLMSRSVLDFGWMDEITQPVIFLAEGVLPYFIPADVRALLLALGQRFAGSEFAFDVVTPFSMWLHKQSPAMRQAANQLHWGLSDPRHLEGWSVGVRLLEVWDYFSQKEPRLKAYNLMRFIPPLANVNRILRCRLGVD